MPERTVISRDDSQTADADVGALLAGGPDWPLPIYICLRHRGRRLWHGWAGGDHAGWIADHRRAHPAADCMEMFLPERLEPWTPTEGEAPRSWTGILGIEVRRGDRVARMPPSQMIAANHSWSRALQRCRAALDEGPAADEQLFRVAGATFIVPLDSPGPARRWSRSGPAVPLAAITPEATTDLAHRLGGWLVRNTGPDGRLVYKYWPSRGRESAADNTVRQFMGTLALGRYARWSGRADARAASERNLDRQLQAYYQEMPDGSGVVAHGGSAKLGAAAIAGLALLEAAPADRRRAALRGIIRGIEGLWQPDGAFRTFHFPAERNDNQNFYPGRPPSSGPISTPGNGMRRSWRVSCGRSTTIATGIGTTATRHSSPGTPRPMPRCMPQPA